MVKRYDTPVGYMNEDMDGDYVLHSGYAALEEENRRLGEALDEIAETCPDGHKCEAPDRDHDIPVDCSGDPTCCPLRIARRALGKEGGMQHTNIPIGANTLLDEARETIAALRAALQKCEEERDGALREKCEAEFHLCDVGDDLAACREELESLEMECDEYSINMDFLDKKLARYKAAMEPVVDAGKGLQGSTDEDFFVAMNKVLDAVYEAVKRLEGENGTA